MPRRGGSVGWLLRCWEDAPWTRPDSIISPSSLPIAVSHVGRPSRRRVSGSPPRVWPPPEWVAPLAQDATPAPSDLPDADDAGSGPAMLFLQSFKSGSIAPKDGDKGRYVLTLEQGLGQTIFFSDRPERIVGATPTDQFLGALGFVESNPPNAALVVETAPGEVDIAVVELYSPVFDPDSPGVTYEIEVLKNWEESLEMGFQEAPTDLATLAPSFGAAQLFIDDCPDATMYCTPAPATSAASRTANTAASATPGAMLPACHAGQTTATAMRLPTGTGSAISASLPATVSATFQTCAAGASTARTSGSVAMSVAYRGKGGECAWCGDPPWGGRNRRSLAMAPPAEDPVAPADRSERTRPGAGRPRAAAERADRVARAKALLAVADGATFAAAARAAGRRSGDAVAKLVARFNADGLAALDRPPRRAARRSSTVPSEADAHPARGAPAARPGRGRDRHLVADHAATGAADAPRTGCPRSAPSPSSGSCTRPGCSWQENRTWCETGRGPAQTQSRAWSR